MQQAVGFGSGSRLLSGLSQKPNVSAYAKGRAMQDASGLDMDREQKNQELGVQQMNAAFQQRQQDSQNKARQSQNATDERMQAANLANRQQVFNLGMNFDYAGLQRRNQLNLQQALLNGMARDF